MTPTCNLYAPNSDSPEFFLDIFDTLAELHCPHMILAGDFNLALDLNKDKRDATYNNDRAAYVLHEYINKIIWLTFGVNSILINLCSLAKGKTQPRLYVDGTIFW